MSSDTSSNSSVRGGLTSFSEDEQQVAKNAQGHFKANQHEMAISILKKLQKSHSNDPRLMHNRALTEFFKSGKTKISDFKKSLAKIQKMLHQKNKEDDDFVVEKNNYLAMHYNQALLFYFLHQYREAEEILGRLYENLDNTDENNFLKVALLYANTCLINHNSEKASAVVEAIEKHFTSEKQATEDNNKSSNNDKGKNYPPKKEEDISSWTNMKPVIHNLKAKCCIQQRSVKACKREIKSLTNALSSDPASKATAVFLKSNFEYMKGNYHKAYKLLGCYQLPTGNASDGETNAAYYNNLGIIHFGMNKPNLGSFYLQKALSENDAVVIAANKIHLLTIQAGNRHSQNVNKPLNILSMNKRFELMYNSGILLLNSGNSSSAFDCLLSAACAFHLNPKLWLRLAECCIQKTTGCDKAETNNNRSGGKKYQNNCQTSYYVSNAGPNRKLVVRPFNHHNSYRPNSSIVAAPTMEFAAVCLKNALTIIQNAINRANHKTSEEEGDSDRDVAPTVVMIPCPPGVGVSGDSLQHLHASVLTNAAFVALHLGNTLQALQYATKVLSFPKLSGSHKYLGHMYAAEALVSLDRISEAIEHLSVERINNINGDLDEGGKKSPVSDDGSTKSSNGESNSTATMNRYRNISLPWHFPSSLPTAHAHMLLNLATSHCLRSEYEKAQRYVKEANLFLGKQIPPQAVLLTVYLNLHNGAKGQKSALEALYCNSLTPETIKPFYTNPKFQPIIPPATVTATPAPATTAATAQQPTTVAQIVQQQPEKTMAAAVARSKPSTPQSGSITPSKSKSNEGKGKRRR